VQPVRRHITEILKENGTATVAELAEHLGMAQVSVRHHLDILVGQDLVKSAGVRRRNGAGRPSQTYALTPDAARLFPQRHDILVGEILTEMKAMLSADELHNLFLHLAEKAAREAPPAIPHQSIEDRLDEVAAFLTQRGYNARWKWHNNRYELQICNCPYAGVADHHSELCMMDQAMMQYLIPNAACLESHVLDGTPHCTYVIEPASPTASES